MIRLTYLDAVFLKHPRIIAQPGYSVREYLKITQILFGKNIGSILLKLFPNCNQLLIIIVQQHKFLTNL
jgi:hypothetical protein